MAGGHQIEGFYNGGLSYCTIGPPLADSKHYEKARLAFLGRHIYSLQAEIAFEDSIVEGKTMLDILQNTLSSSKMSNDVLEFRLQAVSEALAGFGLKSEWKLVQKAEDVYTATVS